MYLPFAAIHVTPYFFDIIVLLCVVINYCHIRELDLERQDGLEG